MFDAVSECPILIEEVIDILYNLNDILFEGFLVAVVSLAFCR